MSDYYIDYSQYSKFKWCEWAWAETYVRGIRRRYVGPRDDALCLGSLVHNGLEHWHKDDKPFIDEKAIEEQTPAKEALDQAWAMVLGYVAKYPSDPWRSVWTERAVRRPLIEIGGDAIWLVAKVDLTINCDEDTQIDNGTGGFLTIPKGWSSVEYKTKGASFNRPNWIKRFSVNKQPTFQQLALRHDMPEESVRGVLVNVIEKPAKYTPRRKCKEKTGGCGGSFTLTKDWILMEDGKFKCPSCGAVQDLDTEVKDKDYTPLFFRQYIERTEHELESHVEEIREVAADMHAIRLGRRVPRMAEHNCVDDWGRYLCEFYDAHINDEDVLTTGAEKFVQVADPLDYIGLTE